LGGAQRATMAHADPSAVKVTLTRDLRLFDITMIGVGAMIGAGIFALTGPAAGHAGPALLLAFLLNGLVALLTASSYAELGAAFPGAGGGYSWAREGLSPFFGFLSGWMSWFAQAVACSLYALVFGSFAAELMEMAQMAPFGLPQSALAAILSVLALSVFTFVNYRGASETGKVGSILTLAKLAILTALVAFGVKSLLGRADWASEFVPFLPNGLAGVAAAMGLTAVAFEGYEIVAQSGEEVVEPGRNIPRAIFLSLAIAVVIYLSVAVALLGGVESPDGSPSWQFLGRIDAAGADAEKAVVDAAAALMPYGALVLLVGGLLSTLSALNATVYSSSRICFAMGRNRDLPAFFGRVHPIRRTPHWAILFSGALSVAMAVALPIEEVAYATNMMFMLLFAMVNASAIALRLKRPDAERPFRVPAMPLLPLLGIASQLLLSIYLSTLSTAAAYAALGWIAVGGVFYAVYARGAEAMPEPAGVIHEEIVAVARYSVLIPVADTYQARLLSLLGSALAADRDGEVFALHVVRVPPQLGIADGRYFLRRGKPILEAVIEEARQRDVPVHTMIRLGRTVATTITKTARERGTDLLLLNWSGYTQTPDAAFGKVIDRIARNPPCDLAVVRFRAREPARRFLVPTAGGPNADLAVELAISQARQFQKDSGKTPTVTLLHVLPEDADEASAAAAARMLAETADRHEYPLEKRVVRAPDPVSGILREAETCSVLMLGASGERLFEQRLFGSIPEQVARETTKTVVMAKRHQRLKSLFGRVTCTGA
jgi:amino acid transporter/nucleotide-binding universal stress UspA family protein